MTQTTESIDYPQNNDLPTEPLRCLNCGTLFTFYSPSSDATLLYRYDKCNTDFDITLKEGAVNYKRRNKRKQTNIKITETKSLPGIMMKQAEATIE